MEPWAAVALAVLALTTAILSLLLFFKWLWFWKTFWTFVTVALVVLGVKVKQWTHPLRQDEVAVVSGRFGGEIKVVMSGRMFLRPGEISTRLSLRWQQVGFQVQCQSGDEVPVTIFLHSAFRIPRSKNAILLVAEKFGDDEASMQRQVVACLMGHVRDVVGDSPADRVDRATGDIADEAMRRARRNLADLGFESERLAVEKVELSDEWRAILAKRAATRAQLGAVEAELAIEDRVTRARIEREIHARLAEEKAKADAEYYVQMRQVELERAVNRERIGAVEAQLAIEDQINRARVERETHAKLTEERTKADADHYTQTKLVALERMHIKLADERRELERQHARAMAELEIYKLRETKALESKYHGADIQRMIVERLPQILEAKGKLLPSLRTYIAGPHDNGLVGLISGLADFGPDIVKELGGLITSLNPGEHDQFSAAGEQPPEVPRSLGVQDGPLQRPDGA